VVSIELQGAWWDIRILDLLFGWETGNLLFNPDFVVAEFLALPALTLRTVELNTSVSDR
jgi:hypothetical protein